MATIPSCLTTATSKFVDSLEDKENITPDNMKTISKLGNPISSSFLKSSGNKNKTFKILSDEEIGGKGKGNVERGKEGTRKSLATLQPSTLGKGSLAGQIRNNITSKSKLKYYGEDKLKQHKKQHVNFEKVSKTKKDNSEGLPKPKDIPLQQSDELIKDAIALMTATEKINDSYWKSMAEDRRIALEETLTENEKLYDEIEKLEQENINLKQKLNESECFKVLYVNLLEEMETLKKDTN